MKLFGPIQAVLGLLALVLSGCAALTVERKANELLKDEFFSASQPPPSLARADLFRLSDEMRRYLQSDIAEQLKSSGPQRGLIDALYSKQQLKIDYDAETTRTAAETFRLRAGNCLSLVIMTAAFAKELGLSVNFQRVQVEETWSRSAGIYFASNHVNVTLGRPSSELRLGHREEAWLTIDFYPQTATKRVLSWRLEEDTIVAMYFNNRAAESLARGRSHDAYWYARAAVLADASFVSSYNTLGVVYRRAGHLREAEATLRHALQREPHNLHAMSNLAIVLAESGRVAEATQLNEKVAALRPEPPYFFFNQAMSSLRDGDYLQARSLLAKEVNRAPYNGEFHFWLGVALAQLGERRQAQAQLMQAIENSNTRNEQALYTTKRALLQSTGALPLQLN